ncbi:uncharacterized protein LOC103317755 isoform X1 [Nasonia vitripennis]|uniref:Uncharacterized protein n=1 Tax=Nasonia vitripennis TaxID=7425 RepID=A0A7M7QH02_NASVI|nr:uncharacterized protein LOC103317755 isoform X1 [Nasonia vitripennis]
MSFASGFWATVELLVALDATSQSHSPFEDDVEDWLENVSSKVQQLKNNEEEKKQNLVEEDSVDYGNLVDCSFSCPTVRSRLELLMGSNVVRLTDRKYMLRLMSRIRQDHESQQEARIQDRKTRELMRTKKMILNRFIPVQEAPSEIRQYPLFQLYLYCDAIIEQRRRKRVAKKVKISKSLYRLLYPEKITDEAAIATTEEEVASEEDKPEPTKEAVVDDATETVPVTREELEAAAKEKELAEDVENGYAFSREEYENLHYEAENVKKLKETRTVDEMYAKAHEIVGLLFSLAGDEKRKRCAAVVREEETTVS